MKLKKFLFSPWSFIPIIGIFVISQTLQSKGVIHPIVGIYNIVDLLYFLLGAVVIYLASRKPKFEKGRS